MPTVEGGGKGDGRERVSGVFLAIAVGSFAVFPGLAPVDGGECHEEALSERHPGAFTLTPALSLQGRGGNSAAALVATTHRARSGRQE